MKWREDYGTNKVIPTPLWLCFAQRDKQIFAGASGKYDPQPLSVASLWRWFLPALNPSIQDVSTPGITGQGGVNAIALTDDRMYIGGTFPMGLVSYTRGFGSSSVDGRPVSGGVYDPGFVWAILPVNDTVLVGGNFVSFDGSVASLGFAKADGMAKWTPLAKPLDDKSLVRALALVGDAVAVGGTFSKASGTLLNSIGLYDLKTKTWKPCGATGVELGKAGFGNPGDVHAIHKEGNLLYVGGTFDAAGGTAARGVAVYDLTKDTWAALDGGVQGTVRTLLYTNKHLVVGGLFTDVAKTPITSSAVAAWDITNSKWVGMDGGVTRVKGGAQVTCLSELDKYLLVCGEFDSVGAAGIKHTRSTLWDWA